MGHSFEAPEGASGEERQTYFQRGFKERATAGRCEQASQRASVGSEQQSEGCKRSKPTTLDHIMLFLCGADIESLGHEPIA